MDSLPKANNTMKAGRTGSPGLPGCAECVKWGGRQAVARDSLSLSLSRVYQGSADGQQMTSCKIHGRDGDQTEQVPSHRHASWIHVVLPREKSVVRVRLWRGRGERAICDPWLVRDRDRRDSLPSSTAVDATVSLSLRPRRPAPSPIFCPSCLPLTPLPSPSHTHTPTRAHVHGGSGRRPILPPPPRRGRRRHGDEAQRDLCGVLLGVVEVLAIVPEPRLVDRAVDGHAARPGCAATSSV